VRQIIAIAGTQFQDTLDSRAGAFSLPDGKFDSGGLYRLLKSRDGSPLPASKFLWESHAPKRVQFFIWLLMQGRIQCRTNLVRKKMLDNAICEVCNQGDETAEHVVMDCPFAKEFWGAIGFHFPPDSSGLISQLHNLQRPTTIPQKHFGTFVALCCWQIWKRRNGVVFRSERKSIRQLLAGCLEEVKLWKLRLPKRDANLADSWAGVFACAM